MDLLSKICRKKERSLEPRGSICRANDPPSGKKVSRLARWIHIEKKIKTVVENEMF
jgi:hypothetical protein